MALFPSVLQLLSECPGRPDKETHTFTEYTEGEGHGNGLGEVPFCFRVFSEFRGQSSLSGMNVAGSKSERKGDL